MQKPMTLRQAVRWAESKDALHLSVVYDASWKANNAVLCIGGRAKCEAFMRAAGITKPVMHGSYGEASDGRSLRLYDLDVAAEEISESDAEALLPERDYRHESWAH